MWPRILPVEISRAHRDLGWETIARAGRCVKVWVRSLSQAQTTDGRLSGPDGQHTVRDGADSKPDWGKVSVIQGPEWKYLVHWPKQEVIGEHNRVKGRVVAEAVPRVGSGGAEEGS